MTKRGATFIFHTERVAGIVNDFEIMLSGYGGDGIHVAHIAVAMQRHKGSRILCNIRFYCAGRCRVIGDQRLRKRDRLHPPYQHGWLPQGIRSGDNFPLKTLAAR